MSSLENLTKTFKNIKIFFGFFQLFPVDFAQHGKNPCGGEPFVLLSDPIRFGSPWRRKGDWGPCWSLKKRRKIILFLIFFLRQVIPRRKNGFCRGIYRVAEKMKVATLFWQQVGQNWSYRALVKAIAIRIARSTIWAWFRGLFSNELKKNEQAGFSYFWDQTTKRNEQVHEIRQIFVFWALNYRDRIR